MKELDVKGSLVLVDDDDWDLVRDLSWSLSHKNNTSYAIHTTYKGGKRTVRMHRLIMGVTTPTVLVDHRDGNGLNNQRSNLRLANGHQNTRNAAARKGTSKYKGVWLVNEGVWRANIMVDRKATNLGRFTDEREAALAYDQAARDLHGEFGAFNFPNPGERQA